MYLLVFGSSTAGISPPHAFAGAGSNPPTQGGGDFVPGVDFAIALWGIQGCLTSPSHL